MIGPATALATALALARPGMVPFSNLSRTVLRGPDLALHLADPRDQARSRGTPALMLDEPPARDVARSGAPACAGDVCQPAVAVPGYEPSYGRVHRSEAVVAVLAHAHVEPLATMGWALVATGLRFDYTPVAFDGPSSGGHGWGSVWLRLRVRLDARNAPVFPERPR